MGVLKTGQRTIGVSLSNPSVERGWCSVTRCYRWIYICMVDSTFELSELVKIGAWNDSPEEG